MMGISTLFYTEPLKGHEGEIFYVVLSRAHDLLSRAHDLLSRAHEIASRAHDLDV